MTALLKIDSLDAFYGRAQALFGVSFSVAPGEVVALLGRNGAGKSTTLKAIMGLVDRNADTLSFSGTSLGPMKPHEIAQLGLGYVPEERRIFTDLTVLENLTIAERPAEDGRPPWTLARVFDLFPNLATMQNRSASEMSGGEQQMLTVARTLIANPSLLLLDEPSEGLAPIITASMGDALAQLKETGIAMILSEQNIGFAGRLADRVAVIENGSLGYVGPMGSAAAKEALRAIHLS